jgi:3-oxoacyl-(acyl-carrier-protein) synthase/SAM-dependent methyltransferase/acyl carrier protein
VQNDNLPQKAAHGTDDLSPVKRALVEIRRLRADLEACQRGQFEPVAILGMAVRLPGGVVSTERFWEALAAGEDLITTVPPERWDTQAFASVDSDEPGTMYDIHGGFLSDLDAFDAEFFGIHPREAASMDPQQRILLELTWEALERGNIDPRSLMKTRTGVYLGMTNSDYGRLLLQDPRLVDGYSGVGAAGSIAAGRIAYALGTHGPAMVIDTACSSSLVAVHQAVQSLRRQETDLAIVGATNLILSPEMNIAFSRTRMLSRDGRCKTFDASAEGYVRAEGCCVIVLKRLAEAVRDGDRVLANIHGSAVNQDGRSAGITAPNGPAQEAVMREALTNAALEPHAVSYVEAHGTGTPLGDPIEVGAIGAVYGAGRSGESPLRIGSVKTNLGHTEAAAGLTGLIKVVLMMQPGHGIPPHLHFNQPSPHINWQQWPIEVPVSLIPWPNEGATRFAGVSSFGFSGTNAHVVVGSSPELKPTGTLRAALPVHSFQRKRFWFGPPPQVKRQQVREEAWRRMREEAERQSLQAPLGWKPESYTDRFRALDRLTLANARNVLAAAGAFSNADHASVDDVLQQCAFQPIYRNLIRRWLLGLAEDGVLVRSGNTFRAISPLEPVALKPYWDDVGRRMEDDPGAIAYLRQCGDLLADVLVGRRSALETLFPDGSFALAEGLYETSAQARYINPIVASAVREAARKHDGRCRVLELGAGTGGTTAAVLPYLPADKVEYWFTDISDLFLNRARRKFAEYPFVRYAICDLDRDFQDQGFRQGMFDLIVAANVIHAARNLDSALNRVQGLLSSGGTLVLLETTHHHSWFDISTGLIEGWQHFDDADRQEHPLLNVDQWRKILGRNGFSETAVFPGADSPASNLGQHVLLAHCPGSVARNPGLEKEGEYAPPVGVLNHTDGLLAERVGAMSSEYRDGEVSTVVKETICQVLRLDRSPDALGDRDRLGDLGMDSLIALELRSELSKRLGLEGRISSTVAFDTGTVGELVRLLSVMLVPATSDRSPSSHRESARTWKRDEPHLTAEQLEGMSEEEVERLLSERLSRQ